MSEDLKKFLIGVGIISAFLSLIVIISRFVFKDFYLATHFITILISAFVTLSVYLLTKKSIKSSTPSSFVNIFMASSIAKMFLLLVYIVGYVFAIGKNNIQFLIFVLISYSIFTVFEIGIILEQQKHNKPNTESKELDF